MNNILKQLKTINLETVIHPYGESMVTPPEQLEVLKEIHQHTTQYMDTRPHYLASITKALQVALEDESIGVFEKSDMLNSLHFMEEELKALGEVNFIKDTIACHLFESKHDQAIEGVSDGC